MSFYETLDIEFIPESYTFSVDYKSAPIGFLVVNGSSPYNGAAGKISITKNNARITDVTKIMSRLKKCCIAKINIETVANAGLDENEYIPTAEYISIKTKRL